MNTPGGPGGNHNSTVNGLPQNTINITLDGVIINGLPQSTINITIDGMSVQDNHLRRVTASSRASARGSMRSRKSPSARPPRVAACSERSSAASQSGRMLDFGNVRLVGMSREELENSFKLRFDDANKVIFMLPDDIIENTVRAWSVDATLTDGLWRTRPTVGPVRRARQRARLYRRVAEQPCLRIR